MRIRLLEAARDDLRDGWHFYESLSPGLGNYFLDCFDDDVRSLEAFAGIHEVAEGFHRMLSKRFPFAIYYLTDDDTIDIYAILDCRRDPEWTRRRLRSE